MNILQKILASIFPPYKFSILRKEGSQLFLAIVDSLPDNFREVKEKSKIGYFQGFSDWKLFPNYKFVSKSYGGKRIAKLNKRGEDFKISGLQLFSIKNRRFEEVEILVQNGFVVGLKITNSDYRLDEFDLKNINNQDIMKSDFGFPKSKVDEFYDNLEDEIKSKLNYNDLIETEMNGKTYFEFYDLEDGNCFAVDKHLKVFSIIHDARPMVKAMPTSFKEMLTQLFNNEFDIEKHFDERYKASNK
ncbi:MAG: hypothetical protein MUE81_14705 [Thermoflexibacter sp.]|jgi:hypothetical protein|nr:hypothetical protein [Thermoflexibacter sp.]